MKQQRSIEAQWAALPYWSIGILFFIFSVFLANGLIVHDQDNCSALCCLAMVLIGAAMWMDAVFASKRSSDQERLVFSRCWWPRKTKALLSGVGVYMAMIIIWATQTDTAQVFWHGDQGWPIVTGMTVAGCVLAVIGLGISFHQQVWPQNHN